MLSEEEMGVLRLVSDYGGNLDLRGPRVSERVRAAARAMLSSGHLSGSIRDLDITPAGRRALTEEPR